MNSWAPNTILDNLDKEFRHFLWGKSDGFQSLPLVSWYLICRSHKEGVSGCSSWMSYKRLIMLSGW